MNPNAGTPWTVVHDFAFAHGGAEVVTSALADEVLDGAPVRYLAGDPEVVARLQKSGDVGVLLPEWLATERSFRALTPAYPWLTRGVTPIEGNVLASSYAFAHHVRCTGTKVVYCHSPLRQVWSGYDDYTSTGPWMNRTVTRITASYLRRKDVEASARADLYIASGQPVAQRLERYYGMRGVPVIAPPVDTRHFVSRGREREDFYLWVGRVIEPYKRLSVVLEAFSDLRASRLLVAGSGPDLARLQRGAPRNVSFLGWQGKDALADLFSRARAVIFSSEDDFGLVPVEAMACGAPVVALRAGGAATTVAEGMTGTFYESPTSSALVRAIREHETGSWDENVIVNHAQQYGIEAFTTKMRELLQFAPELTS